MVFHFKNPLRLEFPIWTSKTRSNFETRDIGKEKNKRRLEFNLSFFKFLLLNLRLKNNLIVFFNIFNDVI
ncbi:hypothetical protein C4M98_00955 [Mycoplasmopsis pullorum]|nr:hypothetical protein C4M94_01095 [Mycoplasmopsis pullorum]TNK82744.1 hypothetical protein C4M80_02470 [Mycoplasmopsis pullorum]TNK85135.1 hypothetical protein C4M92_02270 [Mycoplasmopsis pullorum]TNK85359.1 hypothetical protein C4M85_03090 [Mycoplasmopsis pullorum]TNK86329.1 hypothetical protein C4M82_03690 [Mycoplasmopsis pullorum]